MDAASIVAGANNAEANAAPAVEANNAPAEQQEEVYTNTNIDKGAFSHVQIDGLVLLKLLTVAKDRLPNFATGQLLGMESNDGTRLEVTHCFPTPEGLDDSEEFQTQMMTKLRTMNVDDNTVGWFTASSLGQFVTTSFLEAQYSYQTNIPSSVCVVYDPYRTFNGRLYIKAYRLSSEFMVCVCVCVCVCAQKE
jgi:hypothetical protein